MGARRRQAAAKRAGQPGSGIGWRRPAKLLAICALIAGGWYASTLFQDELVPIENVQIEGMFLNLSQQEIKQQLAGVLQQGYFSLALEDVRQALLAMPWVQDASIRRQWPSGLSIRIEEKRAVAYWSDEELLSDRGELFAPVKLDRTQTLPRLQGPDGQHRKVWQFLVELHRQLAAIDMQVVGLTLDQRRAWSMQLSTGIELHLGRQQTDRRLRRFVDVFAMNNAPDLDEVEYIDLRYPNGFAMHYNSKKAKDTLTSGRNNNA